MKTTHFVPLAAFTLSLLAGCQSTTGAADRTPSVPLPPTQATSAPPLAQVRAVPVAAAREVAPAMVEFVARVEAYYALRERLLAEAPPPAAKATPEELDIHQRALADRIVAARSDAQPGDIFVPEMQVVARNMMARVYSNPTQRAELKAAMDEENLTGIVVLVNTRYPADVPLATMPPDVLKILPALPKDCEYRFVGESLILLDTRAHLVVDVMSLAVPKT